MFRQTCVDCRHLKPDPNNAGDKNAFLCCRYPPTAFVGQVENYGVKQIATMSFYPTVKTTNTCCGEYNSNVVSISSGVKIGQ